MFVHEGQFKVFKGFFGPFIPETNVFPKIQKGP